MLKKYRHLHQSDFDIDFLYGGRDSGKSHFIAQELILKCLGADYFKCILIKKTHESIKDAQWQTIKDIVEDWGLSDQFIFRNSPLEIECKNGNRFIARGCDKPEKLKSIKDPTDAWYEEGNQLTEQDHTIISTTLRGKNGIRVHEWFSFNPECKENFAEFWIYKKYFAHTIEKSFENKLVSTVSGKPHEIRYRATHSTYHDNPFCTEERQAKLENLATFNYYYYKVFTLGEWGNELNESPWLFAFNRSKHVKPGLVIDKTLPLALSWDFNRNPICCSVIQHNEQQKKVRILETIKIPNSGVDEVCNQILVKYPNMLYIVTGDYSGDTATSLFKEHVTNYTIIRAKLGLSQGQIQIEPNPRLEKNRTLVNLFFQHYDVEADEANAKAFIYDAENVKSRADGTIVKDNRDDPSQQADALDTVRYWINKMMKGFEKQFMPAPK